MGASASTFAGRVLAVDSEHMAHGIWKPAAALVGAGVLGQLLWSQTSRHRNSIEPPWEYTIDKVGSRPKVPYSPERYFRWRRFWDYGGGITTDLYYHHITPLIHVTGRGFPVRAVAGGGNYVHPTTVLEVPIVIRGHRANIRFFGPNHLRPSYLLVEPEGPFAAEFADRIAKAGVEGRWVQAEGAAGGRNFRRLPRAQQEEMIGGLLGEADVKEQYDADVKKNPALDGELGYRSQVAVVLGVESWRKNKVAFFDPKQEKMVDAPPAPTAPATPPA